MGATIVCDASPLILLSAIHQINLLEAVFGEVLIASAVHDEVVIRGSGRSGASEVAGAEFIHVQKVGQETRILDIANAHGLGRGEAATLALAEEAKAALAIIDDRRGRAAAQSMGIPVAGTVAILERAHLLGHLVDLRASFRMLQSASGWISPLILNDSLVRNGLAPLA